MNSIKSLFPFLSLLAVSQCAEQEWQWVGGKLIRTTPLSGNAQINQQDLDIEWKLIDGKLTQISKNNRERKDTIKKEIIDIPPSDTSGLRSIDFQRVRDITPQFKNNTNDSSNTTQSDEIPNLKNLSLKDQSVPLPKRFLPKDKKLSNAEINQWGKDLLLTRDWINYHNKRIQAESNISREFLVFFNSVQTNWRIDVDNYEKALNKASTP